MGTYITGITLLKIADPNYRLLVLEEHSVGFAFTSPMSFMVMSLSITMLLKYSLTVNMAVQLVMLVFFCAMQPVQNKKTKA